MPDTRAADNDRGWAGAVRQHCPLLLTPHGTVFSVGGGARLECRLLPAEQEWGECPRNNEGRVTYINLSHGDTHTFEARPARGGA